MMHDNFFAVDPG